MKERPILFTGEMVRAILDSRKTQARRLVKPQPEPIPGDVWKDKRIPSDRQFWWPSKRAGQMVELRDMSAVAPLGTIGDRLWVRETFRIYRSSVECACYDDCRCASMDGKPLYRASDPSPDDDKWTPSIHMPRWASRIDLEITAVRVERVQYITDEDSKKEGVIWKSHVADEESGNLEPYEDAPDAFKRLWQSIYGNWDANPWVWVYEFRRIKP